MKKLFSLALTFLLTFTFLIGSIEAAPISSNDTAGDTSFTSRDKLQKSNEPTMANGFGTIFCSETGVGGAICDWSIRVSGDKINYSNVSVKFEKWNSTVFRWEYVSTSTFNYVVNPSKTLIQDQARIGILQAGFYRAVLGGTFTCTENGVFVATANNPSTFTVNPPKH
ncbi:hypothetical protein [Paenibacillus chitinolyticus]